jgi:hypothetical protein
LLFEEVNIAAKLAAALAKSSKQTVPGKDSGSVPEEKKATRAENKGAKNQP